MTLEDRIALKQTELRELRSGVVDAERELEALEYEKVKWTPFTQYMKDLCYSIPKPDHEERKRGWNAAMDYLIVECKKNSHGSDIFLRGFVLEDQIRNSVEK